MEAQQLTKLEFNSPDRDFLETHGWEYAGSQEAVIEGLYPVYTHYYAKDGKLLNTRMAGAEELTKRRVPIPPDVAMLPVSRQRKQQIAWNLAGLCHRCGNPRYGSLKTCERHAIKARERSRRRYGCKKRNLNARSYHPGGWNFKD